jgi:Fe-S cluster biogenesis protein NfuA
MSAHIEAVVEDLRPSLQANGGDLVFERYEEGIVHLRLELTDEACLDCILPKPILEQVVTQAAREREPGVLGAELVDPRAA